MLQITPVPAFKDNYIWLLRHGKHAAVIDPGDAVPVFEALRQMDLTLDAILITHHHDDHIGGVPALQQNTGARVFAPRCENHAFQYWPVHESALITLPHLDLQLQVMEIPGHTRDHVAYYGANSLFCGDTLFNCGCGRIFDGSYEALFQSLRRINALPPATALYSAHEYTRHNIHFARSVDPDNALLANYEKEVESLRQMGKPTLPTTLAHQREVNPFLRCNHPTLIAAATRHIGDLPDSELSVFCALRKMRNSF